MKKLITAAVALSLTGFVGMASARDYISIVGSSTVYPFATVVAEQFGKTSKFKTPKIESTGSGGGLKLFCAKSSEVELCAKNGVKDIVEVKIGYDGIAIANSKSAPQFKLTRKDLYLALAKNVPNPKGGDELVANPYKTWNQVNADLPDTAIEVLGPPPTSGTRDAFAELVMEHGCQEFPFIKAMKKTDKKAFKAACMTVREDGPYIEAGENDNLIVQKLEANKNALGIFGFSFLDQNADKIQGSLIDGVVPSFDKIADGSYPVSRPLFFYVKKAHVGKIPGIDAYMAEFTSEKAWGDEGYLADKGLIPMPAAERKAFKSDVDAMKNLKL